MGLGHRHGAGSHLTDPSMTLAQLWQGSGTAPARFWHDSGTVPAPWSLLHGAGTVPKDSAQGLALPSGSRIPREGQSLSRECDCAGSGPRGARVTVSHGQTGAGSARRHRGAGRAGGAEHEAGAGTGSRERGKAGSSHCSHRTDVGIVQAAEPALTHCPTVQAARRGIDPLPNGAGSRKRH